MDAQLVLFDDDSVVIDTGMLTPKELEKEYGAKVVEIKPILDLDSLSSWPTDRGMNWR